MGSVTKNDRWAELADVLQEIRQETDFMQKAHRLFSLHDRVISTYEDEVAVVQKQRDAEISRKANTWGIGGMMAGGIAGAIGFALVGAFPLLSLAGAVATGACAVMGVPVSMSVMKMGVDTKCDKEFYAADNALKDMKAVLDAEISSLDKGLAVQPPEKRSEFQNAFRKSAERQGPREERILQGQIERKAGQSAAIAAAAAAV